MKKKFRYYVLAALIGIPGISHCAEQPTEKNEIAIVAAAPAEAIPATTAPVDDAIVTPVVPPTAPILVPFNQKLYQLCCEQRQEQYGSSSWKDTQNIINGVFAVGTIAASITSFIGFKQLYNSFMNLNWFWKLCSTHYTMSQTANILCIIILMGYSCTTIAANFKALRLWEDRKLLELQLKQQIWHKEIYARLGRPTIEGTVPTVGKYHFIIEKKFGAGKVIFDPFDERQVRILLGIEDGISDNLQCTKITIVPIP